MARGDAEAFRKPQTELFARFAALNPANVPPLSTLTSALVPAFPSRLYMDAQAELLKRARLQPNNAFFPWMEAVFQFALERPTDALRALEAAGRCSDFDDYTFRSLAERAQLLRRLRTTGWEDDVADQATALFPHYARMRAAARAASWQMQLARKRKDKATDFRWAAALARAAYPVARSERNSVICVLVGEAICKIAWRAAVQNERDDAAAVANRRRRVVARAGENKVSCGYLSKFIRLNRNEFR